MPTSEDAACASLPLRPITCQTAARPSPSREAAYRPRPNRLSTVPCTFFQIFFRPSVDDRRLCLHFRRSRQQHPESRVFRQLAYPAGALAGLVLFAAAILMVGMASAAPRDGAPLPPTPLPSPDREPPMAMLGPKAPPPPAPAIFQPGPGEMRTDRDLRIARGQSLIALLTGAGVDSRDAHKAAGAIGGVIDLRRLKIGETVGIAFLTGPRARARGGLAGLSMKKDPRTEVGVVRLSSGDFRAFQRERRLDRELTAIRGEIRASLYADGVREGAPAEIMMGVFRLLAYSLDLQRDIQPGDRFELLFERYLEPDGSVADLGEIHYVALRTGGSALAFYRFEKEPGVFDYYDAEGEGARRALLATPLDSPRVTSRYGKRRHPILGYNKMHRGVDFGAPTGTPIRAAGNGTVVKRGWHGAYGRYIRIRHKAGYQTAYAHLRRYAKGSKVGSRVKQGQIIGYVGSSGRSTGPHLHYEVLVNGRQVNPMKLDLPSGDTLKGEALERFRLRRAEIDRTLAATAPGPLVEAGPAAGGGG